MGIKINGFLTVIFIWASASNITFSQQWEKVFDLDRYTKIQDIKSTSDNGIIIGADAGIYDCMAPFIFKLDSTGNIEWRIGYYGIGTEKIFINEKNQILFSGLNFEVDDVEGETGFKPVCTSVYESRGVWAIVELATRSDTKRNLFI